MGTGIASLIMYHFPYPSRWLRICSYIMYGIASLLLAATTVLAAISIYVHPEKWKQWHTSPQIAPFLGAYPMGYTTFVNFTYNLIKGYLHGPVAILVLWLIAVGLSVYTATIVMFRAYFDAANESPNLHHSKLHASILMPLVTLTVVASLGNLFALDLPTLTLRIMTLVCTFILWSNALVMAFIILTIHVWKLLVHGIPHTNLVFSLFLPIGFLGQGSYAIMLFGHNAWQLCVAAAADGDESRIAHYLAYADGNINATTLVTVGHIFMILSIMAGAFLVLAGYVMVAFATAQSLSKTWPFARQPDPRYTNSRGLIRFSSAYWGTTFPLGTISLASTQLGKVLGPGFQFFTAIGAVFGAALILVTIGCISGMIFRGAEMCRRAKPSVFEKV